MNKYFKNEKGGLFEDPIVKKHVQLKEISFTEFNHLLKIINTRSYFETVMNNILLLENSITMRRMREAIISGDNSFIKDVDKKIIDERKKLHESK